jgi:hypothetical protein
MQSDQDTKDLPFKSQDIHGAVNGKDMKIISIL